MLKDSSQNTGQGATEKSTGKDSRIENPLSPRRVMGRFVEWTREMPGIFRGLYELAHPFRRNLVIIFFFNIAIAAWETAQPLVFKYGIDEIAQSSTYAVAIALVIIPVLILTVPHGIILPFFRDLYSVWFFRPLFEKRVGLLCLDSLSKDNGELPDDLRGTCAPVAQEGRIAALGLTETLLREPAFALRGVVVLIILFFTRPWLALIVLVGMLADLFVTVLMDERLFRPYALQREFQFRIRSLEYKAFDDTAKLDERQTASLACLHEWENYVEATRNAERWRLIYQMPIRETISVISRTAGMLLVAWWVMHGTASIGDYYWIVQLASRANDPLFVILGIQQNVMTTRESLRRLGTLCKIDFGIANPKISQ